MAKFVRRLQKIGSSVLVSLPKEWVDANGLGKGSQIELDTGPDSVSISANRARPARELAIPYPLPKEENIVADITGAYLLGYDLIDIRSPSVLPAEDREKVRSSMRWLGGMEIVEEDASHVSMQCLLDSTTLDPGRILRRMGSIALGMYEDASRGLVPGGGSGLASVASRDVEVNRQYFLLVRLIRGALADRRLAGALNLGDVDVLDYRVAASLLENAGDYIVELAGLVAASGLSRADSDRLYAVARDFGAVAERSVEAFTGADRLLAIEAISMHREFAARLGGLREAPGRGQIPIGMLDMVHTFERIARSWADVADLVRPIYN